MTKKTLNYGDIPPVSEEDQRSSIEDGLGVPAWSSLNTDKLLFLKFVSHTKGTAIVNLTLVEADRLLRTLQKHLPKTAGRGASPTKWAGIGIRDAAGYPPKKKR